MIYGLKEKIRDEEEVINIKNLLKALNDNETKFEDEMQKTMRLVFKLFVNISCKYYYALDG